MNGQTRFCQDGPNIVYFLPHEQKLKITQNCVRSVKIWFGHPFLLKLCFKNHNVKIVRGWNWRFQYWLQPRSQIKTLCPVWKRARAPDSSVTNEIKNFVTYLPLTSFFVKSSFYDVTQGNFTSFFESDWFCNIKSQLIAANYWVRCLCWCTQKSSHQISAPQQVLNFWQNTVNLGKILTLLFCLDIFNDF